MSVYSGQHAAWYDVFYAEKSYQQEALFINECLRTFQSVADARLLELACGTGTHAFALEQLGYKIVATDSSPEMISRAREKAVAVDSAVEFRHQDMRALNLGGRQFDAAICLFDSIGYVETNEAVVNVLCNVRDHLCEDGIFVFEFWHAAAMLRSFDPLRVRRWAYPGGELLRISQTELDHARQTATVTYTIYDLKADGTYSHLQEAHRNRYFSVQEMAQFLSHAGFAPIKWFSGFTSHEEITDQTWHVVAVVRKRR